MGRRTIEQSPSHTVIMPLGTVSAIIPVPDVFPSHSPGGEENPMPNPKSDPNPNPKPKNSPNSNANLNPNR